MGEDISDIHCPEGFTRDGGYDHGESGSSTRQPVPARVYLFSRVLSEIQEEILLAIQINGHPPVSLMQVCRLCRNLIMNMSRLCS